MSFQHDTARWTARRSYVVLAFILIIIALILAGCARVDREDKTVPVAALGPATDAMELS